MLQLIGRIKHVVFQRSTVLTFVTRVSLIVKDKIVKTSSLPYATVPMIFLVFFPFFSRAKTTTRPN